MEKSVFDRFKTLAANESELTNCLPELSATFALKLFFGGAVNLTLLPAGFLPKVEQILTVAESLVQNELDAKKAEADREYQEKKAALEAVAKT
ncbi:MAG: hypothetical protein ACREFR_16595, partial [Limisphaerales bacterium]